MIQPTLKKLIEYQLEAVKILPRGSWLPDDLVGPEDVLVYPFYKPLDFFPFSTRATWPCLAGTRLKYAVQAPVESGCSSPV